MARNPYAVLGLAPTASDSDIRAAFRKLAMKYHPDRNPDDKRAEEKFKEISAAFDVIGDSDRRRKFDRGEIDEEGREKAHPFGSWGSQRAGGGHPGHTGDASFEDLSDIFSDLFSAKRGASANSGMGGGFSRKQRRGGDIRYSLEIDFLEAVNGIKKRVTMPDGRTLDLVIPSGLDDGQTLRLRGQGERGPGGAGDVYVEVSVNAHPDFERDGLNIIVEMDIGLREAVLGGKITVPTIAGNVSVNVPPNSSSGATLRLRERGISTPKEKKSGDQLIRLKIVLPEGGDAELEAFVKAWKPAKSKDKDKQHFAGV